jgi:uncharacterized protein (DUF1697 family)
VAKPKPTTYAFLLRGINVGGRKLPMADLRRILTELGHVDVRTYLASGQGIATTDRDPGEVAKELEQRLADEAGLKTDVVMRSGAELAAVLAANPFPGADEAGNRHAVVFLSAPATAERTAKLTAGDWGEDRWVAHHREIYLHLPNGFADSKLGLAVLKLPDTLATARNWNTTRKLAELTAG